MHTNNDNNLNSCQLNSGQKAAFYYGLEIVFIDKLNKKISY